MWGQRRGGAAAQLRHGSWALQIGCKRSCCCSELGLLGGRLLLAAALLPAVGQRVVHVSVPAGRKVEGEAGARVGGPEGQGSGRNLCGNSKRQVCPSRAAASQPKSLTGPRCG